MLSFVLIFDHVQEISVPCLLTDRRAFDMASHPDYGVSGCGCFGEFRDFGWGCFADMPVSRFFQLEKKI